MSNNVYKWSNVAIAMQSALGAAKTIASITNAAPGVVGSVAHGFLNGEYVYLAVDGMWQLNDAVFRVCNKADDTFQLESVSGGTGIDTTDFDVFTSGTAQKITFGNSITTAVDMNVSGGNQRKTMPGLPDATTYSFNNNWDPANAGQVAMKTASRTNAKRAFKFTFGTGGPVMVFSGRVGFNGAPAGSAQDKVLSQAVITSDGDLTFYSA
jgi:hypothetical protein